jgi:hypothetical protein
MIMEKMSIIGWDIKDCNLYKSPFGKNTYESDSLSQPCQIWDYSKLNVDKNTA